MRAPPLEELKIRTKTNCYRMSFCAVFLTKAKGFYGIYIAKPLGNSVLVL